MLRIEMIVAEAAIDAGVSAPASPVQFGVQGAQELQFEVSDAREVLRIR